MSHGHHNFSDTDRYDRARPGRRRAAHTAARGVAAGLRPRTRDAYGRAWHAWAAWCADHGADPWSATRGHVDAWARALEADGYAPATVALRLTAIGSAYRYAVENGDLPTNPVQHVRRPKPPSESPTLGLDRAQAQAVLTTAAEGHPRDLALVALLLLNGLRVSEATGATLADLATVRGHRVLTVQGKGSKTRRAPLAPRTVAAIERHVGERTAGPVLLSYAGTALTRSGAARIVRRVAKAAGVDERISPHSLRHTWATLAHGRVEWSAHGRPRRAGGAGPTRADRLHRAGGRRQPERAGPPCPARLRHQRIGEGMTTKDLDSANKEFEKLLAEVGDGGGAGGEKQASGISDERKAELRKRYQHLDPRHRR